MSLWGQYRDRLSLMPIFGAKTFGANTTCGDIHHGPIPDGDRVCCMNCYATGVPDHPDLKRTALDDIKLQNWKPKDGKDRWSTMVASEPTRYAPEDKTETRREKRAKQRGPRMIVMDPKQIEKLVDAGVAIPTSMIEVDDSDELQLRV